MTHMFLTSHTIAMSCRLINSVLLISFFCLIYFNSHAQINLSWSEISEGDGLTSSYIYKTLVGQDGQLWIGTEKGLCLYDGYRISSIDFYQDSAQIELPIYNIVQSRTGQLWLGTKMGLKIYDPEIQKWISHDITSSGSVDDILFLSTQRVLVSYYTGFFDVTLDELGLPTTFEKSDLSIDSSNQRLFISELAIDNQHHLYLSIVGKGIVSGAVDSISFWRGFPVIENPYNSAGGFLQCSKIVELNSGDLLINYVQEGVFIWHPKTRTLKPLDGLSVIDQPSHTMISTLHVDKSRLFISQSGLGLFSIDLNNKSKREYYGFESLPDYNFWDNQITSIQVVDDLIWLGTLGDGIKYAKLKSQGIEVVPLKPMVSKNTALYTLKTDQHDNLWIGTFGNGLIKMSQQAGSMTFEHFTTENNQLRLPSDSIGEIHFANNGALWIATANGLVHYNPLQTNRMIDGDFEAVTPLVLKANADSTSLSTNVINDIFEDVLGNILLTSASGINVINTKGDILNHQNNSSMPLLSHKGGIYYGAYLVDSTFIFNGQRFNVILRGGEVVNYNDIFPDTEPLMVLHSTNTDSVSWISTTRGIYRYDPNTGLAKSHMGSEFFNNIRVNALIAYEDHLWLGTSQGLYSFDMTNGKIGSYVLESGSGWPFFHYGSVTKSTDGMIYFGTNRGIVSIDYQKTIDSNQTCVQSCTINVVNTFVNQKQLPHKLTNQIEISHLDMLEIQLGFPIRHKSDFLYYRYSLDGQNWLELSGKDPKIILHQLNPDSYNLRIQALTHGEKIIDEQLLLLNVEGPWYARWYAIVALVIIILITMNLMIRTRLSRERKLQQMQKAQDDMRQKQEHNDLKFEYISNISHELRTPLTLMQSNLSTLRSSSDESGIVKLQSNIQRLKRLANELVDMRGVNHESLRLTVEKHDIVEFIKQRVELFQEIARKREISLQFLTETDNIPLWFNPHQFEKVIFNLISNAFKFTPNEGQVVVKLQLTQGKIAHADIPTTTAMSIAVEDNGRGIPDENLDDIFRSDYSSSPQPETVFESAGIGLYLCKKIVSMHRGSIEVENVPNGGAKFSVFMPIGHFHFDKDQIVQEGKELAAPDWNLAIRDHEASNQAIKKAKQCILVVEDEPETRDYLKNLLETRWHPMVAKNGIEGIQLAKAVKPDLILTDLSMPGKNGVNMINQIKADTDVNQIPIIVLSSHDDPEKKTQLLKQGVDGFLTKPVNDSVLVAMIENHMKKRAELIAQYSDHSFHDQIEVGSGSALLKRAVEAINQNISDPTFDVAQLAQRMKVSRSLLYLKLSGLTNYSPKEFIHVMRVRKAAKLLRTGEYRVNEVGHMVGFNTIKSFRKYFKMYFGVGPSAYIKTERVLDK